MKEIKFRKINNIKLDEKHDVGVLEINGGEFVQCGGDVTARGIVSFIRPYDKAKDKLHDKSYARGKKDVVYYMDNHNTMKLLESVRNLRIEARHRKA